MKSETKKVEYKGEMTIASILNSHPDATFVLASYGFKGCHSCKITDTETIEEAAHNYRIPLSPLLDSLNNLNVE